MSENKINPRVELRRAADQIEVTVGMLGAGCRIWLNRHGMSYCSDEQVIMDIYRFMEAQRRIEQGDATRG